jgi:ABC-2 type transport system ATP-binding protein
MRAEHGIEAEGLVRTFKGDIRAVDGIDLAVRPGEIYGFLGPNGAGKSTTVHMLTTLLPPTAGHARVAGFDVEKEGPAVRRSIGAALQEAALDPLLTGREHLRLQCALHGISRRERKVRATELLERVGLTLAADRKVKGYSGGMKRRLDLALALAHRPTILSRRADNGARPAEPKRALAGGRAARPRGRRHRLPDDSVPRGGRRARGPGRDH